jgi:hypothetical protein
MSPGEWVLRRKRECWATEAKMQIVREALLGLRVVSDF